MRNAFLQVLVCAVLVATGGCANKDTNAPVTVHVTLARDVYLNMSSMGSSSLQYSADVTMKNDGHSVVNFGVLWAKWSTSLDAKGLQSMTMSSDGAVATLAPRDSVQWNLETDGYTDDIVTDADGKPAFLFLLLLDGEGNVIAAFQSDPLPRLDALPGIESPVELPMYRLGVTEVPKAPERV